jgi:hypothetical protein
MGKGKFCQALYEIGLNIEGTREQCTVVFALIVTEQASEFVCGGGSCCTPRLPFTCRFRNILGKADSAWFSRFLHGVKHTRKCMLVLRWLISRGRLGPGWSTGARGRRMLGFPTFLC